jgi:hypothetical protein
MFLSKPKYEKTGDTRDGRTVYRLTEPLVFCSHLDGDGDDGIRLKVPTGFLTDLASVHWILWWLFPRLLRWLFPPEGLWRAAVILHDYLYGLARCSRFLADALFREALAQVEVFSEEHKSRWDRFEEYVKRVLLFYLVRFFGGGHKVRQVPAEE